LRRMAGFAEALKGISPEQWTTMARALGAGLAMGLGAVGTAVGMGLAGGRACEGIARQPDAKEAITRIMLLGQATSETSSIFALLVAILLIVTGPAGHGLTAALGAIGAGLSIGLGAMYTGLGSGFPNASACSGVARNPDNHGPLIRTMLVGQAVAQGSAIFALLVSFILIYSVTDADPLRAFAFLSAGLCMGAGAMGPGVGMGMAAAGGCEGVSINPSAQAAVMRVMLLGQAVAQSTAVYALIIAICLIYVVR